MKDEGFDFRNLMMALILCTGVLLVWQVTYEMPKRKQLQQVMAETQKREAVEKTQRMRANRAAAAGDEEAVPATREGRLALSPRLPIDSPRVHGSIALRGARFDDLTLSAYRQALDKTSPPVILLSPSGGADANFAQFGWLAAEKGVKLPDDRTLWKADRDILRPGEPVTLTWDNGEGQLFSLIIALDSHYMFSVTKKVENRGKTAVTLSPYSLINRAHVEPAGKTAMIVHQGPIGVFGGALVETDYASLREETKRTVEDTAAWLGFSDKYWLTALVPDMDARLTANFSYYRQKNIDRYQADMLGSSLTVEPGQSAEVSMRMFAGAKEMRPLDAYAEGGLGAQNARSIPLFDRAVDLGTLYFLTKPMLWLLAYFFEHTGNFGIAILLLTVAVKLLMYPLANKAYHATTQMRDLQPEMVRIRERVGNDKVRMNQEIMSLYRREKVNPASGCLPVLVQIPVFLALYKVLMVAIEMRHAPFFAWIHDLSAPDPSNFFTLFGLIDWNPPALLHIGVLPILMTVTMAIQMKQQPKPADPVQAKIITYMPYIFLVIFASFPAGLVLYWVWSNILSIIQQMVITKRHHAAQQKRERKKAA